MTRRSGSADLPLHGGRVPQWLTERMSSLGGVICQAIVYHYGREELLARLAHPFWFQSFGAVMGGQLLVRSLDPSAAERVAINASLRTKREA